MMGSLNRRNTVLAVALAVALLGAAPVGSAQLITLEAKDMPVQDAIVELRNQTGLEFGVFVPLRLDEPVPKVTASFRDTPLKRALEVISEQTGFAFDRIGPTQFHVSRRPAQPDTVPTAEVDGYRVRVRSLAFSLGEQKFGADLLGGAPGLQVAPTMSVDLEIDAPLDVAGARVAGLADGLEVKDATGQVLRPLKIDPLGHLNVFYFSFHDPSLIKCKWDAAFPSPDAKTMEISGALLLWRQCDEVIVELPWGKPGEKAEANGVSVTGVTYDADAEGKCQATVSANLPWPNLLLGQPVPRSTLPETFAWAVWPSGHTTALYMAPGALDRRLGTPFTCSFARPRGEEGPPAKLRVRTYVKADPTLTVPFRIENIPLPGFPDWARGLARPPAGGEQGQAGKHAFWADGDQAGRVEFDVLVGDRPVPGPLIFPITASKQKEGESYTDPEGWAEVVDERGHVVLGNLQPGRYALGLHAYSLGKLPVPELHQRLAQQFGIDPKQCTWINTFAYANVETGTATRVDPVRFVTRINVRGPRDGEVVGKEALTFSWEAFPGATTYRVSLGVREGPQEGVTFWVSNPTPGTELKYVPEQGRIDSEAHRGYGDLKPGAQYYWYVSALDAEGKTVSQTQGAHFHVK